MSEALLAGRYRLVSIIATGGMGVVWEGWDERLERSVAIKQLRALPGVPEAEREVAKERAMREARITARLHHPHAVPVFDAVEHEGQPCLVMQLLPSTPLSAMLRDGGPLPVAQVARIGTEIASALAAAHSLGIVHRDVKPGNILITTDGAAHISDFGISHAMGDATLTRTGMIHGTPAYLAPEAARGEDASFPADVFSLGSTLYAAVEGAPPFGSDGNSLALLHKVAAARVPPPARAGQLTPFLVDMLAAEPESRPSMEAVAASLADLETDHHPTMGPVAVAQAQRGSAPSADAAVGDSTEELEPSAAHETGGLESLFMSPDPLVARETAVEPRDDVTADATAKVTADGPAERGPRSADHRPPRGTREGRRRPSRAAALVMAAVVLLLVLLVAAMTDGLRRDPAEGSVGAAGDTTASAPAPTPDQADDAVTPPAEPEGGSEPQPSTAQQPLPEPEPEPEPDPDLGATRDPGSLERATQLTSAITDYYALLPGGTDQAWPRMTADYQTNHAGGFASYEEFWNDIDDVSVSDVEATPPDRVVATLTYSSNGRVDVERTGFRLVDDGGVLKIAASEVLSSRSG